MSRSRASAKNAGTRFEKLVASYLSEQLEDDRVERRAKTGAKDRGDITGLRINGQRAVAECKNQARILLPEWWGEALDEAGNDDAPYAFIVHKRVGRAAPEDQWVTMSLGMFARIIGGGQ